LAIGQGVFFGRTPSGTRTGTFVKQKQFVHDEQAQKLASSM
jgi:hypothetical protein